MIKTNTRNNPFTKENMKNNNIKRKIYLTNEEELRFTQYFENKSQIKPEPVLISTFGEYVDIIRKANFYRGESKLFKERTSAAIRPAVYEGKKAYHTLELCEMFYRETFSQLTENEKENFLAFTQHYGIPTNLLDITTSPLVALFFACAENPNEDGYAYCFYDDYIDCTNILPDECLADLTKLIYFINNNELVKEQIINLLEKYRSKNRFSYIRTVAGLIDFLYKIKGRDYLKSILDAINKEYISQVYKKSGKEEAKIRDSWYNFEKIFDSGDFFSLYENGNYINIAECLVFLDEVTTYVKILSEVFVVCCGFGSGYKKTYGLTFIPNILYNPLVSFDRAVKQSRKFICQPYIITEIGGSLIYNEIMYSSVIQIKAESKSEILNILDKMDINIKTIFRDFDSIAKYIIQRNKIK